MLKKIRSFLKAFIFVDIGGFVGKSLFVFYHYKRYPGFYAMQSAPWYTEILATALVTAIIVTITLIAYIVLGYIIKKSAQAKTEESHG